MPDALTLDGLVCVRGGRRVFGPLDFAVPAAEAGTLVRLAGRNGTGKSSLLRILAGIASAAGGSASFGGAPLAGPGARREARPAVLYAGHRNALKPWLTVRENLAFRLTWSEDPPDVAGAVAGALEGAGLSPLADLPAAYLSFGQSRRLALAPLWVTAARLILLDEPATGLDEAARGRLDQAIADRVSGGATVVMATHDALPAARHELRLGGAPAPADGPGLGGDA